MIFQTFLENIMFKLRIPLYMNPDSGQLIKI